MANRGIWEAIASAGPAASFAHRSRRRRVPGRLDAFLETWPASRVGTASSGGDSVTARSATPPSDVPVGDRYARTSGSSNASLVCDSPVFASG